VLLVAGAAATVTRYVALRTWVFAAGRRRATRSHRQHPLS
jgi:putative flippase GtrA